MDQGKRGVHPKGRLRRPSKFTIAVFLSVIAVGVIIGFLDFERAWNTVKAGDLRWVGASLAASVGSYVLLSASFGWIFVRMGVPVPMGHMMLVGFTSSALNNLMPVPTIAGHGIRLTLLRDRGVSAGDTLAASAFHSFLSSFVLIALFPIGLLLLVANQELPDAARFPLVVLSTGALVLLIVMSWIIFHAALRRRMLDVIERILQRFIHGREVRRGIDDFDRTIENGINLLKRRRGSFAVAVALDLGDWIFTALTLGAAFLAFGAPVGPGVLLTGMVVGIVVGLSSLVPGGLGLQEASMAGVFTLLGVPFYLAVLVALLFRVTYHIVPFSVALLTYTRLMQRPFHMEEVRTSGREIMETD